MLGGLPEGALAALLPDLSETPLPAGRVLHEPEHAISEVFFPLLGVVSVVAAGTKPTFWSPASSRSRSLSSSAIVW